jgi:hypothetical protein
LKEFIDIYSFLTSFKQNAQREEMICYVYTAFGIKKGSPDDEDLDEVLEALNIEQGKRPDLIKRIKELPKTTYTAFREIVADHVVQNEDDEEE